MKTRRGEEPTRHTGDKRSFPVASPAPIVTLLTDFGNADYFVAAVKGVILSLNPAANLVDISHDIAPHDIETAAFTLLTASPTFPPGTIHLAVVDPGVGSSRRPILVEANDHFFVGPDNGIFSYVCERSAARITHLDKPRYFRQPVSQTFNGRDVFAPIAAALSLGVAPAQLGTKVNDYIKLQSLQPERDSAGKVLGRVIHVDRFGNCVTNLTKNELSPEKIAAGAILKIKGKTIRSFRNYFAEQVTSRQKLFAIWGSAGFLEIAAANASAAKILKLSRGDKVIAG